MNVDEILRQVWQRWPSQQTIDAGMWATVWLVAVVGSLRFLISRLIRRAERIPEGHKLRWNFQLRWLSFVALASGLLFIWATELRSMAVPLLAFAVAIVIAIKELLLCLQGAVLRASAQAFSVGDRIEINGLRGDVIDHGLLATTIVEIGPGLQRTGRAITIPNSQMLEHAVTNETFTEAYVSHVITLPLNPKTDWQQVEKSALEISQEVCRDFLPDARKYMFATAKKHGLSPPYVEPRIVIRIPQAGELHLLLRVPSLAREKGRTEQLILRRLLEKHPEAFQEETKQ